MNKNLRPFGAALFFIGVLLGLALAFAAIWANFEAVFYNYTQLAYDKYQGLHCPTLMTTSETATVSATFDNPSDEIIYPYYKVQVSSPGPLEVTENQISVAPHESQTVKWTVDASNIDMDYFVIVKLTVLPLDSFATRETTCGIFALDIPGLSGSELFWLIFTLSVLGVLTGFTLWAKNDSALTGKELSQKHAMQALAVLAFLTLFVALIGWWLQGILLTGVTFLFMVVMLRFAFR